VEGTAGHRGRLIGDVVSTNRDVAEVRDIWGQRAIAFQLPGDADLVPPTAASDVEPLQTAYRGIARFGRNVVVLLSEVNADAQLVP
jgi:hypothetical protein